MRSSCEGSWSRDPAGVPSVMRTGDGRPSGRCVNKEGPIALPEMVPSSAGGTDPIDRVESARGGLVRLALERVQVTLSVEELAACFASMDDSAQARFLAELARLMDGFLDESYGKSGMCLGADYQMDRAGRALAALGGGARAAELLRSLLEAAEEELVAGVMRS